MLRKLINAAMAILAMALIAPVAMATRRSEFTSHAENEEEGRLTATDAAPFGRQAREAGSITATGITPILGDQLLRRLDDQTALEAATRTNRIPASGTRQLNKCSALRD